MSFRVSGYVLNPKKEIFIALTIIYGIGINSAKNICAYFKIANNIRVKDLDANLAVQLTEYISDNYVISNDLKKQIVANKKKYIAINCYRGKRLRLGLPVRGQKTKSNARTVRILHKKLI